jgi:transposase
MYIRRKKSGKNRYLQVIQSYRDEKGRPRQKVIGTLGKVEDCESEGVIASLMTSLSRFDNRALLILAGKEDVSADAVRIGPGIICERLWKELGIGAVIKSILARTERKFEFDVERAIFLTVMHRLFAGGSDRSAEKWRRDLRIAGAENLDLHHLYRAMWWLGEEIDPGDEEDSRTKRHVKDEIEEELFSRNRHLFAALEIVFFDTTSIYFEGEGGELGEFGHSKDHRPDLKQMVVGAVIDDEGRPICCELWPGSSVDVTSLKPVTERLRERFGVKERFCIVADAGMISRKNTETLDKAGIDYILGVRMRQVKEVYGDILQRGGRWQEVTIKRKHNNKEWVLKAKESFQGGRRYIVCLNEEQARRDAVVREAVLTSLKDALSQGSKSLVGNRGYRKYLKTAGKGFVIDHDKAEDESRYDGKWVLRTSLTKMSAPEVALKYKELWQVEKVFRDVKSVLETRPIYHRRDETIRGHVFCSFLALILRKELEKRLQAKGHNFEWSDIRQDLEALQQVEISSGNKQTSVRTECKGVCGKVFQAVGVAIPPVIRSLGNGPPPRPKQRKKRRRSATQENCVYNQPNLL